MNLKEEMSFLGKKAVNQGLVETNMGNFSVNLLNNSMLITKSGHALDELCDESFTIVNFDESKIPQIASREAIVHMEIYKNTDAFSVFHSHSSFATIMSLSKHNNCKALQSLDVEGEHFLNEIQFVEGKSGSLELARKVADVLQYNKSVIVIGHGVFAKGESIVAAYNNAVITEHSSKILYYTELRNILM